MLSTGSRSISRKALPLVLTLRTLGAIDMVALAAVIMPKAWITGIHWWIGLGEFPAGPVAGYLARSASVLYAVHGLLVIYISFDLPRYWYLIRLLAFTAVGHGAVMVMIDVAEQMPTWWTVVEGPTYLASGVIVLASQAYCRRDLLVAASVAPDSVEM